MKCFRGKGEGLGEWGVICTPDMQESQICPNLNSWGGHTGLAGVTARTRQKTVQQLSNLKSSNSSEPPCNIGLENVTSQKLEQVPNSSQASHDHILPSTRDGKHEVTASAPVTHVLSFRDTSQYLPKPKMPQNGPNKTLCFA